MEDRMRIEDRKKTEEEETEEKEGRQDGKARDRHVVSPIDLFSLRPSSKKTTGVRHISHYVLYPAVWLYVWLVLDCRCRSTG